MDGIGDFMFDFEEASLNEGAIKPTGELLPDNPLDLKAPIDKDESHDKDQPLSKSQGIPMQRMDKKKEHKEVKELARSVDDIKLTDSATPLRALAKSLGHEEATSDFDDERCLSEKPVEFMTKYGSAEKYFKQQRLKRETKFVVGSPFGVHSERRSSQPCLDEAFNRFKPSVKNKTKNTTK